MPELIEIEGNIVRHVRRDILATTSLEAAAPYLEVHAPTLYPIMPANTLTGAIDEDNKRGALLVELQPQRVHITVHFDRGLTASTPAEDYNRAVNAANGRTASFHIQLPYLYFLFGYRLGTRPAGVGTEMADFTIDMANLYMTPQPVRDLSTKLWKATMLNVKAARICWGYTTHDNDTLATRINHMITEFPVSTFNNHYGVPLPRDVASLVQWEKQSKDPLCYRKWKHWERPADGDTAANLVRLAMRAREDNLGTQPTVDYMQLPENAPLGNILIPAPPPQFTIARLREWMQQIPEPLRHRFLAEAAAAGAEPGPTPEEAYAAFRAAEEAAMAGIDPEDDEDFEDDDEEDEA